MSAMSNRGRKNSRVIVLPRHPDTIRALIESAGGSYGSVVYVKKDGNLRKQTFQRGNDEAYCLNTPRGIKASATFVKNNPDMMRLRDAQLLAKGDPMPWRTVTLTRVLSARINRQEYRFV